MRLVAPGRAGRFSRENARTAQLELAKANIWFLGLIFAGACALPLVAAVLLPEALRGLVIGAGLANAVWVTYWLVVTGSGSAPKMSGADAAEWTSKVLRRMRRAGWRHFDELPVDGRSDIDHVAFGTHGVYAIETKWSASKWFDRSNEPTRYLMSAVEQAARGAAKLRTKLADGPRGIDARVSAVLVLWGMHAPDRERVIDGVAIVPGDRLGAFFERRSGSLDALTVDRIGDALTQFERDGEGARHPENRYVSAGLFGIAGDIFGGLVGGTAAMLLLASLWDRLPLPVYVLLAIGSLGGGLVGSGAKRLRTPAIGWTVGTIGMLLLFAIAAGFDVAVS